MLNFLDALYCGQSLALFLQSNFFLCLFWVVLCILPIYVGCTPSFWRFLIHASIVYPKKKNNKKKFLITLEFSCFSWTRISERQRIQWKDRLMTIITRSGYKTDIGSMSPSFQEEITMLQKHLSVFHSTHVPLISIHAFCFKSLSL